MVKVFEKCDRDVLVLQDDILPCKDFQKAVDLIVKLLPDQIISFFSAYDTETPLSKKKHWLVMDRLYGTLAYVMPLHLAKRYLEFNKVIKQRIYADDVRISMFMKHYKLNVFVTCPSLVEHLCWQTTSQSDNKVPPANFNYRIAKTYIGYENSALDINWKRGLNSLHFLNIGNDFDFIRHYNDNKI